MRSFIPGNAEKQTCCDAVDQAVVDLVRDDQQVVLLGDGRDLHQALAGQHRAGRVVRIADQKRLVRGVMQASISAPVTWKSFSTRVAIGTGVPPAKVTSGA